MTTQTDISNARRWLEIEDLTRVLKEIRSGVPMGVAFGNSAGLGQTTSASDDITETNKTPNGKDDVEAMRKPLQVGDKPEKFELKDCETGEAVTLDGIGGNGTKAVPPVGFDNCEVAKKPTMQDLEGKTIFRASYTAFAEQPEYKYSLGSSYFYAFVARGINAVKSDTSSGCEPEIGTVTDTGSLGEWSGVAYIWYIPTSGDGYCGRSASTQKWAAYSTSNSTEWKQAYIDSFEAPVWDAADKNHLNYNTEKGCIEPLCPDLNPHVSEKFQECQDEFILCDEDNKKVHVKINSDGTMDVTQEQYGQTATIKDGRVSSVKIPAKSQLDRLFNE